MVLALTSATGFDTEEIAIDVVYWFDKSTKRKAGLEKFCVFCDTAYKVVIAHASTHWPSLEKAVTHILEAWLVISTCESQARFVNLKDKFSDNISSFISPCFLCLRGSINCCSERIQLSTYCIHR